MIGKLGFSGEVEDRAVEALIHGKYRIIAPEHASEAVELVAPVIAEAAYRAGIEAHHQGAPPPHPERGGATWCLTQ